MAFGKASIGNKKSAPNHAHIHGEIEDLPDFIFVPFFAPVVDVLIDHHQVLSFEYDFMGDGPVPVCLLGIFDALR